VLVRRLLITLVVFACIAGLVLAAQHTRRGDVEDDATVTGVQGTANSVVELQAPAPESSVLNQAQILLDLTTNYDATFTVQGVPIPDDELQKTVATGVITFTPGPGKVFEKLPQGRVCASANVFRIDGTVEDPRTVTWCFNVT
jgi:hypothetical protein